MSTDSKKNSESLLRYALLFMGKSVRPWIGRRLEQARAIRSDVEQTYPRVLGGSLIILGTLYVILWYRALRESTPPRARPLKSLELSVGGASAHDDTRDVDVIVVGAGVAGASTAFHLAHRSLRVLLVDRAQRVLSDMGVLQTLLQQGCYQWINTRGFVSPSGDSVLGTVAGQRDLSVQRIRLDDCLIAAAEQAGVTLREGFNVGEVRLVGSLWTVREASSGALLSAPMLVLADGSESRVGRQLGLVRGPPESVAGRAFVEAGTHSMTADCVSVYPRFLLPGHLSFTRLVDDHLVVHVVGMRPGLDIHDAFLRALRCDAVRRLLGDQAVVSALHVAPLRTRLVPESCADRVLLVGDAAGHVDPLTGLGVQYGLEAAQVAALTIAEGFAAEDLSRKTLRVYQHRVSQLSWGFSVSSLLARLIVRFPVFIDAALRVIKRRGSLFLSRWCEAMAGDSWWFLQQMPMIAVETIRLKLMQLFNLRK